MVLDGDARFWQEFASAWLCVRPRHTGFLSVG